MKRKFGEQTCCHRCGQDIEWHGREHGWIDRGANRECPPYQKRGEIITPKGLKHGPVMPRKARRGKAMSKTPRTDHAFTDSHLWSGFIHEFCRDLELENARLRSELEAALAAIARMGVCLEEHATGQLSFGEQIAGIEREPCGFCQHALEVLAPIIALAKRGEGKKG